MRIVIKVGTSTLAYANTGRVNIRRMEQLCKTISDVMNAGNEIIFVSSGAIGMGMGKLGLDNKPKSLPMKQACAAVGQCELMYTYDKLFGEYNHTVAQILLTGEDIQNVDRKKNFINTVETILSMHALPILNENDTISTSEIEIGDNDTLGAVVAQALHADLYVILSDIDGLYTADPNKDPSAKLIEEVHEIDQSILDLAGDTQTKVGTGGMITKLTAAQIVTSSNCDMVIINGSNPENIYEVVEGKKIGTRFIGKKL